MNSSKWTRRNKEHGSQGFLVIINTVAISIAFFSLLAFLTDWMDKLSEQLEINLYLVILQFGVLGCFIYWVVFNRKEPNEMRRVIKISYEDADFPLRKLFKEKRLVFIRRKNEDGLYVYALTGRDVTMTIYPYDSSISHIGQPFRPKHELKTHIHTLIEIPDLNVGNKPFAEELALAIDDISG